MSLEIKNHLVKVQRIQMFDKFGNVFKIVLLMKRSGNNQYSNL